MSTLHELDTEHVDVVLHSANARVKEISDQADEMSVSRYYVDISSYAMFSRCIVSELHGKRRYSWTTAEMGRNSIRHGHVLKLLFREEVRVVTRLDSACGGTLFTPLFL